MNEQRERVIQTTWRDLAWVLWNPRTNGFGAPLTVAGCEYRLERRNINGLERPCIECEGIVVEVSP